MKYKARLIAKGFTQKEGVDYFETFAPVTNHVILRLMFALSTTHGFNLRGRTEKARMTRNIILLVSKKALWLEDQAELLQKER